MTFKEYSDYDGLGLAALIKAGEVSPAEVTEAAIERAERHNPAINAIVHKGYDDARAEAKGPLPDGPFKPLLVALHRLQQAQIAQLRIRTALVTARSAPAHERAIRTLMDWNIDIDEAMFLGGLDKGEFLREFEPDFFFDDQTGHIESAARHVPSGHVASGIRN